MDKDEYQAAEDAAVERHRGEPDFDEEEFRAVFREGYSVGQAEGFVRGLYDALKDQGELD